MKIWYHGNGRTKSDDLKTGTISKYGLNLETIGTVMDRCLCVDTNLYVFLSNIELGQYQ